MRYILLSISIICFFTIYANAQGSKKVAAKAGHPPGSMSQPAGDAVDMNDDQTDVATVEVATKIKPELMAMEKYEGNIANTNPPKGGSPTPLSLLEPVYPPLTGKDPMVAVGENYFITCEGTSFAYYKKGGGSLLKTYQNKDSGVTARTLFDWVIDEANNTDFKYLQGVPGGTLQKCNNASDNEKNKIGFKNDPAFYEKLNDVYDASVIYEPVSKRFVILAAVRNTEYRETGEIICDAFATRTFVFAISVSENPLEGFDMWYWTTNNYRDWPKISVDKDVLTMVYHGGGDIGTPAITVISLADMLKGESSPRTLTYKYGEGVTPNTLLPVEKFSSNTTAFDDYEMYIQESGSSIDLYYFKKSADMWTKKPELKVKNIDLQTQISLGWQERAVYRNGNLYFTSTLNLLPPLEKYTNPYTYGFFVIRVPLEIDGGNIWAAGNSPKWLTYPILPAINTDMATYTSYEAPALSVDAKGTMLVAYGKTGRVNWANSIPETRYFLFYENEKAPRASNLLKKGTYIPLVTPTGWKQQTTDGYYHNNKNWVEKYIDFSTVTMDPKTPSLFWIAHVYPDNTVHDFKMIVQEVQAQ